MKVAIIIFILLIGGLYVITGKKTSESQSSASASHSGNLVHVTTDAELNALIQSGDTLLVDFWAEWCGPCRTMNPIVAGIAADYPNVTVVKVDVDQANALAQKYHVQSIPTFIVFDNGRQKAKEVGAVPERSLTRHLN